jgi:hypothetical protein
MRDYQTSLGRMGISREKNQWRLCDHHRNDQLQPGQLGKVRENGHDPGDHLVDELTRKPAATFTETRKKQKLMNTPRTP